MTRTPDDRLDELTQIARRLQPPSHKARVTKAVFAQLTPKEAAAVARVFAATKAARRLGVRHRTFPAVSDADMQLAARVLAAIREG